MNAKTQYHFFKHVDEDGTGCWLWNGVKNHNGYGLFWNGTVGKRMRAHRVSYEFFVGPISEGLVIDHLCRVRHCVNPDHLEPVTTQENTRRGELVESNRRRAKIQALVAA